MAKPFVAMPIKARWELHGAYFQASGTVMAGEILGARKFMLEPPNGMEPKYQIIDARNVEKFDFDQMDLLNISAGDLAVGRKYPEIKIAVVTGKVEIEETMLGYMKNSWAMGTKAEFGLFIDLPQARNWIGLPYPESKDDKRSEDEGLANSLSLPSDR